MKTFVFSTMRASMPGIIKEKGREKKTPHEAALELQRSYVKVQHWEVGAALKAVSGVPLGATFLLVCKM